MFLRMSENYCTFAPAFKIMPRHSYIVLLLTALMWFVCSSNNCRLRPVSDTQQTETTAFATIIKACDDCALPVQIEKIQVNVVQLTARQQLKRISETIFGHHANTITTHRIARRIYRSQHILLNLATYDIGFPFSAFW